LDYHVLEHTDTVLCLVRQVCLGLQASCICLRCYNQEMRNRAFRPYPKGFNMYQKSKETCLVALLLHYPVHPCNHISHSSDPDDILSSDLPDGYCNPSRFPATTNLMTSLSTRHTVEMEVCISSKKSRCAVRGSTTSPLVPYFEPSTLAVLTPVIPTSFAAYDGKVIAYH
jgi:hypothetical protein